MNSNRGALILRAEITPSEPGPGNAGVGKRVFYPADVLLLI